MATNNMNNDVDMNSLNTISNEISPSSKDSGFVNTPESPTVIGVSGVSSVHDTTTFVDDANVMKRDESSVSHVNSSIVSLNDTQAYSQSIKDFLAKPVILANGNFATTDTYSFLNSYNLPKSALDTTQGLIWRQKLAGYFGIRMDMRVRLVINANKFQQGRYCVGWVPFGGIATSTSSLKAVAFNNMHMATLVQRTTVPHVEIDLATGTSAELLIPFVSSQSFYPLNAILANQDISSLGYLNVYPYAPLVSPAGSTTASYTLYVSFENIQLIGAASAQSGYNKSMSRNLRQSEIGNKSNGPISSTTSAISRGFKEFSSIPLIGSICNDVSWVADRITGVASIFGFSKPLQGDSSSKVMFINATNHTTIDGDSDARPLSLLSKPGVTSLEGLSGTVYDEMDFSYVVRKYAWFRSETWTTSSLVDAVISTIDVKPSGFSTFVDGKLHLTPVSFVSTFFALWRGSVKLKFKFVKTEFHSGRLSFAFYPCDESSYVGNSAYVNRLIVDVRETSEVEIIVPYISRTPWLNTQGTNTISGKLVIAVVDPLVAPATVSSNITILMEASGGNDLEFSVPSGIDFTPCMMVPQSGFSRDDSKIISATIGNSTVSSDPLISTSICIGEKITSFRPFLRRFTPIAQSTALYESRYNLYKTEINVIPDAIIASQTTPGLSQFRADAYSVIGSCYCLSRGGVRIRDVLDYGLMTDTVLSDFGRLGAAVNTVSHTNATVTLITDNPGNQNAIVMNTAPTGYVSLETGNIRPLVIQNTTLNNSLTVEVPQYTRGYARCISDTIIFEGASMDDRHQYLSTDYSSGSKGFLRINVPSVLSTYLSASVGNYTFHSLYRAAADDASFMTFISVPPMVFNATTTMRSGFY